MSPRLMWENVNGDVKQVAGGYLVFDDTVSDKRYARQIELARRQYSGNAHGVIRGIGIVTCVYVNQETEEFWLIDYRIFDPDGDGKSKLDHVHEMLTNCVYQKQLRFRGVLMDSWYATRTLMLSIEQLHKVYYCPLKDNRLVDDSDGVHPYLSNFTAKPSNSRASKAVNVAALVLCATILRVPCSFGSASSIWLRKPSRPFTNSNMAYSTTTCVSNSKTPPSLCLLRKS